MRHGSSSRRSRSRNSSGRRGSQSNKSRVYDSNGPDVRIRGTAHQIFEKYIALAKDAEGSGDRVLSESYLQHAEHYQRIISGWIDLLDGNPDKHNQIEVSVKSEGNKEDSVGNKDDDLGLPDSIIGKKSSSRENAKELTDA